MRVARAFVSLCQLEFTPDSPDDKRYDKYQLSLVCILTTLCTTARNDFLIYDAKLNTICLWQNGMELMRNCYCNRAIPVDRAQLLTLRDAFLPDIAGSTMNLVAFLAIIKIREIMTINIAKQIIWKNLKMAAHHWQR